MKAMVLAAGKGTRLRPLTFDIPKVMVPIQGRPLLEHTFEWLRAHGITQIAVNLHHMPEIVTGYFGDGARLGVRLTYSVETDIRGTAGGVKALEDFLDERFVLVYGDVLTDLDLAALITFHRMRMDGPHLTMALYRVPDPTRCGIVSISPEYRIERFVEKPSPDAAFSNLASAGVLILDPEAVAMIPDDKAYDFGRDIFPRYLHRDFPMFGWELPESARLIDVGSPGRYETVRQGWPAPPEGRSVGRT
jgi:NDP-sugar pyrophosphorylase family protein